MQLTRATDYAVRIMIHLAILPEATRLAAPELARGINAPESFVSKILQQLVQHGLVTSYRGAGGGFQLAIPPEEISLLHVVEMMEGPLQINLCLPGESSCCRKSWCGAHPVWNRAQDALKQMLASASIAQLARDSAARISLAANLKQKTAHTKNETFQIEHPIEPSLPGPRKQQD
ncbi:MAG: Rrf2 family transcriptional regulator [Terriglobales bacterium]|jgi:Rrf2 family protein